MLWRRSLAVHQPSIVALLRRRRADSPLSSVGLTRQLLPPELGDHERAPNWRMRATKSLPVDLGPTRGNGRRRIVARIPVSPDKISFAFTNAILGKNVGPDKVNSGVSRLQWQSSVLLDLVII